MFSSIILTLTVLATILPKTLGTPLGSNYITKDSKLVKRMDNEDENPHEDICLCVECFIRRMEARAVQLPRSHELFPNPAIQEACSPLMAVADAAIGCCEDDLQVIQARVIAEKWRRWLKDMCIDPEHVQVVPRGSEEPAVMRVDAGPLDAPGPVRPMRYVSRNDTLGERHSVEHTVRRRRGSRQA